ncbi:TPA: hypothetical protein DIS61_02370 [Patescibacteria group bacterium]|nr:MAG: hypothetical protein A2699_00495 [Candidatus Gottesmanbacteria bacterium RIFCSPHIGHO2_01_FULL_43_15]OGG27958.1 MAG: hypothetical protein A3A59_02240 [Candidatus Gottesmanbacteria bacterium RIFCSPLOWO2_01_FULL_42_10]HCM37468.1 hypothetical protein [Patescibacteria group bacterium]
MNGEGKRNAEVMIVDTDVLVQILRGRNETKSFLQSLNEDIKVSRLTVLEIIKGVRSKTELHKVKKQLNSLAGEVVEIDEEISFLASEIFERFYHSYGIGIIDSFIAATALLTDERLVTLNRKHFQFINGLTLVVPKS